ncbi:hypothetical protein OSB04_026567 [Centaurea solstitialis]|uniref:Uncharacterized protein n=1 Tax=Centaurea solstitialis TaxID=347529 RepID=A0AA38SQC8_9ASTR|nr:hypothetical protein OSB04_026567 [Centaurea solstitialis]
METLASSVTIVPSSATPPLQFFSPRFKNPFAKRLHRFPISSKNNGDESDLRSDSNNLSIVPISSNRSFSKDDAMGLVLSAANVRGWTTGSGMEGPSVPAGGGGECESST